MTFGSVLPDPLVIQDNHDFLTKVFPGCFVIVFAIDFCYDNYERMFGEHP